MSGFSKWRTVKHIELTEESDRNGIFSEDDDENKDTGQQN